MNRKLDEAQAYFKSRKGFQALFYLFRQKYESLGRFGGTIDLARVTDEELEELALFMGASPHHLVRKGKLALSDFEQRLQQTRFAGITLLELLEAYFGQSLQSKKAAQARLTAAQTAMLDQLKQRHPHLTEWFTYIKSRTTDTRWIWRLLLEPGFAEEVDGIAKAYDALPDTFERYPLFSQRVLGDPHALDLTTGKGKLWVHLLHVMAGNEGAMPAQTEALNELLQQYRLLRDDIQNFVTQANLIAYAGDREHPVWRSAVEEQTVMNVPLRELLRVDQVTTARTGEGNARANVYIVENSGVFSALLDAVPDAPLLCTHGQFKLTGLQLMDKLAAFGHKLYYSGDFDPEGLSMALRFKERYGERARLWHLTAADYYATHPAVALGNRVAKLDALLDSELAEVAQAVKETAKAGYQEGLLPVLIQDLRESMEEQGDLSEDFLHICKMKF